MSHTIFDPGLRLKAGMWVSTSRDFAARYRGRCGLCGTTIEKGDDQRFIMRNTKDDVVSAWAHGTCAKEGGIPSFAGK